MKTKTNNNTRTFANLVTKSGLTQSQIGRILGVSQQHVSRMAAGTRSTDSRYITALSTKLSAKKEKEKKTVPAKPKKRSR